MNTDRAKRYTSVAIILHWLMAFGFFLMLISGLMMANFIDDKSLQFQMFQWHKSGGVILLLAAVLRLLWRLGHRAPSFPAHFPKFEQWAAKFGHWGLYALMFLMPLTGWIMVSASVYGLPTIVFGLFEWPHIPYLQGNQAVQDIASGAHTILAITFATLIVGHVAAVVKHAMIDHENLLTRMWWSRKKDMK